MSAGRYVISLRGLWARDHAKCHLCGLHVPRRGRGPLRPTRDHVVPLHLRPHDANTLENIRLAHFYCNTQKGSRAEVSDEARRGWANFIRLRLLAAMEGAR